MAPNRTTEPDRQGPAQAGTCALAQAKPGQRIQVIHELRETGGVGPVHDAKKATKAPNRQPVRGWLTLIFRGTVRIGTLTAGSHGR